MSDIIITTPLELTDAELDFVSGGANSGAAAGAYGLLNVVAGVSAAADHLVGNVNVLNNAHIPVTVQANVLGGGII